MKYSEGCQSLKSEIESSGSTVSSSSTSDGEIESYQDSGSENLVPLTKVYKRRWVILLLFSLVTMSNATLWITLSSITNIAERYYRINSLIVDWSSMSFLLACAVFALPAAAFLSSFGLKATVITGASLNAVGTSLRYAGARRISFLVIGTCSAAVGSAFCLILPAKISALWFPQNERATATSIGVFMNLFGVAVGFLLSTTMVPDSADQNIVKQGMYNLFLTQAIFCTILLVLVYLFVKDKPPVPPSMSEALRSTVSYQSGELTLTFKESLVHLGKNWNFHITSQAYAINYALLTSVTTLLNQLVSESENYFASDQKIGMMGFIGTLCGILGTGLAGLYLDKTKYYKCIGMTLFFCCMASMIAFTVVLTDYKDFVLLFALFCSLNLVGMPFFSCGLDQVAEITYPVKEDTACTIPTILGNFYGFICTYVLGLVVNAGYIRLVGYIVAGLYGLGFLYVAIVKVPMNRTEADSLMNSVNNRNHDNHR